MRNILAINDEAHHCYRERPVEDSDEGVLKGDDKKEAEKNREAARLWISALRQSTANSASPVSWIYPPRHSF